MAIWRFVFDVILSPIFSSLYSLLSLFGLNHLFGLDNLFDQNNSFGQQFTNVNIMPTTQTLANMIPQLTTPMAPPLAAADPAWSP